ncbi:MAG: family 16 glycosylhydrolase [Acidimicrobiales bacterium]
MRIYSRGQWRRLGATRGLTKFVVGSLTCALAIGISGYASGAAGAAGTVQLTPNTQALLNAYYAGDFHHRHPSTTTTFAGASSTIPGTTTTRAPAATTTVPATTTTGAPSSTTTNPTTTIAPLTTTTDPPTTTTRPPTTTTTAAATTYPVGVPDSSEPSGMAPPTAGALANYGQSYVNDFTGSSLSSDWNVYTGNPGSDPGAQFGRAHVVVSGGMLQLNTWQDPAYGGEWVTGGLCQCGHAQTYGAYFVRARVTGDGPTAVMLLWPAASVWPPEIDFNETAGHINNESATVHYGSNNSQIQRTTSVDLTQWHTWGVVWTATSVIYTVDGKVWGTVSTASAIPNQAMTLDLQQQTWCSSHWACPSAPQSLQVDWVAEYTAN